VAASSAFPVYLTPVVLKNYSAGRSQPEPNWTKSILEDSTASDRLKYVAFEAQSYTDQRRHFIHLLDGGLSDNLGLRGALDRAIAREQFTDVPSVPAKLPRRVAIIVVDAHTESDYGWDSREGSLGLGAIIGSVGQVFVSHYSFETVELFREVMARLSRERAGSGDSHGTEITTYVVELKFNQLADKSDRQFFNSVPCSLQLPPKTVDRLRQLAARQLADNKEFKRLLRDLSGDSDQSPDKKFARNAARLSTSSTIEP
jgi:NTE family protein